MIRGGLQKIPHSSAVSFFSHNSTDNYAAVNKLRYFIDSYIQTKNTKIYIDTNTQVIELGKIRNTPKGSSFIKTKKPNITLIIMEGIPNAIFDDIYDSEIQIPNLSRIKNKSYSFENMYASGFRTDQGILNLLAGIPAYPYINIMTDVSTIHNQPNLIRTLHEEGYYTSFLYGGDGQFSQLKKYMLHQKLDYYSDESNFDSKSRTMDWGVPDHVFLNQSIKHIKSLGQPHFTTLLTSSTHLPFDYPGNAPHENSKKENFIGSLEYLDNALGPFIDSILISDENNLIIITADHGCLYLGHDFNDHKRFNVPFLVLGNALSDSLLGTQNFNYFNTHDLPKTIESLLNIESNNHPLSSDLTSNKNKSSAYWITEHTMGWLTPKQRLVTDHSASDVYFQSNLHLSSDDEQENLLNYYNETQHYLRSCIK